MAVVDWCMSSRSLQQFFALYKKNAVVSWRNLAATILRLFLAPFLFLLLALLIDKALQANERRSETFKDVTNPSVRWVGDIPSCHSDIYIASRNCTEILYSPDNAITRAIMGNVTSRNSIAITATAYASQDSIQAFLFNNPETVIAAVFFIFDTPSNNDALSGFVLETNTSVKFFKGTYQDPNYFVQLPLQSAVQREISRYFMLQNPNLVAAANQLTWNVGLTQFAHPTIATVSVLGQVLGPFIFAACMFSFVAQINVVVNEKENGLRQALRTMGMTEMAYWSSWGLWELTLAFFSGHLITCFGLLLQLGMFLQNNYGLLFFLFFLFQLSMSSMALFVCAFIKKTQIAVYIGFSIFLLGWIMQTVVIFGVPYTPSFYWSLNSIVTIIFSAFPWCTLAKGVQDLSSAAVTTSSPGLRWDQRSSYCLNIPNTKDQFSYNPSQMYVNFSCVMSLDLIYKIYIILWVGYFVLAIYFDNILPNEFNVRRPFYYFLLPSYWFPSLASKESTASLLGKVNDNDGPQDALGSLDDDVAEEESKVRALLNHRTGLAGELAANVGQRNAVEMFGLKKVFPSIPCGSMGPLCCFCCASTNSPDAFWAIKGSWLTIEENQLFCLLGPNGAGKSTTINCLTGVLPPSHGEALVYGESISSTSSMDRIRSMMGVCPQFDVLWGELSGVEHLKIYGHIKGIYWRDVEKQAEGLLEKVKLTYASAQRTSAYSGGMKRRLSVAIALLGDPKIVYLDEPTTGMDPISRRYVWDIIQEAKSGRAIVLTTHSMEEADILGDRIAIMAKGKLRCLGTSLRLKQKFGSGYQIAVSVVPPHNNDPNLNIAERSEKIKAYFHEHLGLVPSDEGRVYIGFLVPRGQEDQLMPFLKRLEADSERMGVTDIQISLTSLEEVFLNIAMNAEIEEARSNANVKPIDVPLPDGTVLRVPRGMESVVDPTTSMAYTIRWGTDESGNLCVLECKPIGNATQQNLQPAASVTARIMHQMAVAKPVPAPCGTADVTLPDGTLLRLPMNQPYVLNPVDGKPYAVTWGNDKMGNPVVLNCTLYNPDEKVQEQHNPGVPATFNVEHGGGNSRPMGEGSLQSDWRSPTDPVVLPGALPSHGGATPVSNGNGA